MTTRTDAEFYADTRAFARFAAGRDKEEVWASVRAAWAAEAHPSYPIKKETRTLSQFLVTYRGGYSTDNLYSTSIEAETAEKAAEAFMAQPNDEGMGNALARKKEATILVTQVPRLGATEVFTAAFKVKPASAIPAATVTQVTGNARAVAAV